MLRDCGLGRGPLVAFRRAWLGLVHREFFDASRLLPLLWGSFDAPRPLHLLWIFFC